MIARQFRVFLAIQVFHVAADGSYLRSAKKENILNCVPSTTQTNLFFIFIRIKITFLNLLLLEFFSLKEKGGAVSFALIYYSGCSMSFPSLML